MIRTPPKAQPEMRACLLLFAAHADAELIVFTNRTAYLNALAARDYVWVHESFEFREMEGTAEDQKFLWFDQFTLAFANPPPPKIAAVIVMRNEATLDVNGLAVNADYTLERSSFLTPHSWTAVQMFTASTSGTNLTEAISVEPRQQFYRVRSP